MKAALAIILAFAPMTTAAQSAFCMDDLADISLQFKGLPPLHVIEPGTATGFEASAPFVTVQLMLGIDARDLEARLAHGARAITTLGDECIAQVPDCTVSAAPLGSVPGYIERVAHSGLAQFKWRTALDGQMLTLRITTSAPANPDTENSGAQAWKMLAQEALPPC